MTESVSSDTSLLLSFGGCTLHTNLLPQYGGQAGPQEISLFSWTPFHPILIFTALKPCGCNIKGCWSLVAVGSTPCYNVLGSYKYICTADVHRTM